MPFDLKSLKERIIDELNDSVMYMEKAIEHKGTKWSSYFCQMSKNELEHTNILLKIFNDIKNQEGVSDAAHKDMYASIMDGYVTSMSKIEALKKVYWSN